MTRDLKEVYKVLIKVPLGGSYDSRRLGIEVISIEKANRIFYDSSASLICQLCAYVLEDKTLRDTNRGYGWCSFMLEDGVAKPPCLHISRKDNKEVLFLKKKRWRND